jgi:STE24 endopeptidase
MSFDPQAATAAYVDALGADALAKTAAYTTGNHWLLLWGLAVSAVVTWLIVRWGIMDRVAARLARSSPNLRVFAMGAVYFAVASLLFMPWSLYEEWWREQEYGRTSQPLGDFLGQELLSVVLLAVLGALFFVGVYALMRRSGRRWWIWSGAFAAIAFAGFLLAAPVAIEPLFNDYKPVPAGEVRDVLVEMASRSGVPIERVFVYDGSRQSNRFTAKVYGVGGSARIAISDVAFKGASLEEVRAVTGHEIGHYVLQHAWRKVLLFSLLSVLFFFLADRLFSRFAHAFGSRATLSDPAGLPVLMFMASVLGLLALPIVNAVTRDAETAADRYSLETVGLPDALATALVKTAEYRNPRPGVLEEQIFYSHPSVERRIRAAMEWKASRTGD